MEKLIKTYFQAFSNKNIEKLERLFSDEVILKDWEMHRVSETEKSD